MLVYLKHYIPLAHPFTLLGSSKGCRRQTCLCPFSLKSDYKHYYCKLLSKQHFNFIKVSNEDIIAIISYYLQMLFHYIVPPLNCGQLTLKTSDSLCLTLFARRWFSCCGKAGGAVSAAVCCAAATASTVTTGLEPNAATASALRVWELDLRHSVTITYEISWVGAEFLLGMTRLLTVTKWVTSTPLQLQKLDKLGGWGKHSAARASH